MSLPTFPPFEEPSGPLPDALYAAEVLAHRSQAAESFAEAVRKLTDAEMQVKDGQAKKAILEALKALTGAIVETYAPQSATRYVI